MLLPSLILAISLEYANLSIIIIIFVTLWYFCDFVLMHIIDLFVLVYA